MNLALNALELKQLQQLDREDELTMQDYIEARGWFHDGPGKWKKTYTWGCEITSLQTAYEQELAEETAKLN